MITTSSIIQDEISIVNSHSTTWMIDLRKIKCQTSMIRLINDVKYEETLMHLANGHIEEVKMICCVSLIRTITI